MLLDVIHNKSLRRPLNENFNRLAPTYFLYQRGKRSREISEVLRDEYSLERITKKKSFPYLNNVHIVPTPNIII